MRETLWGFDPIYLGWLGAVLILAALLAVPAAALVRRLCDRQHRSSFLAHWIKASVQVLADAPALT